MKSAKTQSDGSKSGHALGLLDGWAVVAAVGDGCQDLPEVSDVCQDGVDVAVDRVELAHVCGLLLLHVSESGAQIALHSFLSTSQRVLQLLHLL